MMQDKEPLHTSERTSHTDDGVNLLDYLIVLAKRKKLILGITLGAAIITALISLAIQPVYRAETKVLVPQQQSSRAAQMLSQLGAAAGLAEGGIGIKTTNDLYIVLLESRTILDRIIDRFDLMKGYRAESREAVRNALGGALEAQDDKKSSMMIIAFEDKDPKRAADIANAFVEELKIFNKGLAVTEASQRRLFFEEQLKDAETGLAKAEESMKDFQEKSGAVKIDAQATAVIEGISQLRAQIAAKEIQMRVMKTYATSQNPEIQRAEEELKGLREQFARLESGNANRSSMVPAGSIPSIETEYIRKMRDLKFNETLYELFLKQYEAAKLDEVRDATMIQVIESAIPPEKRLKPKRRQMVLTAMVTGFFLSVCAAFLMEYKERASNDPESRARMEMLKRYISFKWRQGS